MAATAAPAQRSRINPQTQSLKKCARKPGHTGLALSLRKAARIFREGLEVCAGLARQTGQATARTGGLGAGCGFPGRAGTGGLGAAWGGGAARDEFKIEFPGLEIPLSFCFFSRNRFSFVLFLVLFCARNCATFWKFLCFFFQFEVLCFFLCFFVLGIVLLFGNSCAFLFSV